MIRGKLMKLNEFLGSEPTLKSLKKLKGLHGIPIPSDYKHLKKLITVITESNATVTMRFNKDRLSMDVVKIPSGEING